MIFTLILALPLAVWITVARRSAGLIRSVWSAAKWWERAAMLLLFAPIPGPVDEVVAALVIRRVLRRNNQPEGA